MWASMLHGEVDIPRDLVLGDRWCMCFLCGAGALVLVVSLGAELGTIPDSVVR